MIWSQARLLRSKNMKIEPRWNYPEYIKGLIDISKRIENSQGIIRDGWYHYLQGYIKAAEAILKENS